MRYEPDLARLPLPEYRELLRGQTPLPSRRALWEGLDDLFARIEALGIPTVAALLRALSTPQKIEAFAARSGVDAGILQLLKREAGALAIKPVALCAFPGTDPALLAALAAQGVKTSKEYFESAVDPHSDLYALCDLARINGIGPNAARMFLDAGYRSAADIAAADAQGLLRRIAADNAAHRYYRGTLGIKDMQFCIDMARLLLKLCQ